MHSDTSRAAQRAPRRWWVLPRPGLGPVAGIVATASALYQLLAPPVLGLADNGDYKRILSRLHLVAVVPPGQSSSFRYIWLDYLPGATPDESYQSTELVYMRLLHKLVVLLGFGPGIDLRAAGISQSVLLGIAVWLIVRALPGPLALRLVTSALLIVVLTDTRFVVYLNSFFTEPAALLALLLLIAAVLHAWRRPIVSPVMLLAMTGAAGLLVVSKSQNAPLAGPVAILLLARRCDWRRLAGPWYGRLLPGLAAILVLASAGSYLEHQPPDLDKFNRYNAVFVEILGHSSHPVADLNALGVDPELVRYTGRAVYLPHNAFSDPHFNGFFDTVTHRRIADFYITHPGRGLALAHRGATAVMELEPRGVSPPLGTETLASGSKPYYSACKLCLYSGVSRGLRSESAWLVPALWLAALAAALALIRRRRNGVPVDGVAASLLLVLSFAVMSMAIALLGEGEFEIVKHLFLTAVSNALLAVLVVHAVGLLMWHRSAGARSSATAQRQLDAHGPLLPAGAGGAATEG